jgi:hypothetical protein
VVVEHAVELVTVRARLEVELSVESVESEEVAVAAARRAGPGVASRAEPVAALARRGLALPETPGAGIDAPHEPVREGADRGVRVIDDERQERVPCGAPEKDSGGERFSPSQVCRIGIVPPVSKASLVISSPATAA